MTFDHQINFDPATSGSAATALKAERQVIVRKLLVAQAFADSAGSTTAMRLSGGGATFGALWATPWADSDSVLGSSPASNHDIRRTHVCGDYTAGNVDGRDHACTEAADMVANG
jgi:hypothetical protein